MLHVVLVEPEIPQNTGNIARTCLAAGARLHLVGPLGFKIDSAALRRAGMDYWEKCDIRHWLSLDALRAEAGAARFWFLSAKGSSAYWDAKFADGDHLVFGRETRGLPDSLLTAETEHTLTIPMTPDARGLNLATSVGIVLYEACRQLRGQ
jgi:tRNA (cytidine/uridine-2'-O-)-methyltransferase